MAQQARPNVAGQTELLRMYPASCSTVVSRKPAGSFSSIPIAASPSVPLKPATTPHIGVRDEHREDEQHHLYQCEQPQSVEGHRERVKEDALDIENDEEHRSQVVLDGHLAPTKSLRCGFDPAFVGVDLG